MSVPLAHLTLPDDSGRDAFQRYRYQAHVAFHACLECVTEQGVVAVACEHFEDLLVERPEELRFTQIKTRNPEYGLWRFPDLCRERGGALVSLLRTHRALKRLKDARRVVYEVRVEGPLAREDPIRRLLVGGEGADEAMARTFAKALRAPTKVTLAEARAVLARVRVRTITHRENIADENLRKLMSLAGYLRADDLKAAYDGVIELICQAMTGELLRDDWPGVLFEPVDRDDERRITLAGKRLDAERLRPAFGPVLDGNVVRLADEVTETPRESALVRKLRLAGAGEDLVRRAAQLRATASKREFEVRSRDLTGAAEVDFEDLDQRLLIAASAAAEQLGTAPNPAGAVFASVLDRLNQAPGAYDPKGLLAKDGLALMGGVCQLSDECRFDWRRLA